MGKWGIRLPGGSAVIAGQSNANNYTFAELLVVQINGYTLWQKWAFGGTSSAGHWMPGSANYNGLRDLLLSLEPKQKRVVWWIQGESDAGVEADSLAYGSNMITMAAQLEVDVGVDLHWIDCRLSDGCTGIGTPTTRGNVNAGKAAFVAQNTRAVLVDTDGLEFQGDNLHYTAAGRAELGQRMLLVYP